ncbi:hypothetical protein B0H13DRAFT_2337453 [Mycena leptocephala]|nr:hypothetical protein B0H13DRAFT_2337453 [Mycena leptocephala]
MATSPEKTAEFAKLFDLFEMLANRRSRIAATGSTLDDTRAIPIPADLESVFRSLATTVVPLRQSPSNRSRRNTFPLGKTYTFTFKMMIHKLYQVDEWAQKVRDVLKKSQIEYKPLAEREEVKKVETDASPVAAGRVHFKAEPFHRRPSKIAANARAPSAALTVATTVQDDVRAVKKRCIGRRKSVSGPLSPASPIGEGWIYDAAISSAEIRERIPVECTTTFTPVTRPRPRYQSLQTGSRKMGFGPRRIVSAITTNDGVVVHSTPRISTKRRLSE